MGTVVSVGQSSHRNAFEAGMAAARQANENHEGRRPQLMLAFATAGYDQDALLQGVKEGASGAQVAGCSAEGIITQQGSNESTYCVGVMALSSDELRFATTTETGLATDPGGCGERLARWAAAQGEDGALLLLFVDGLVPNVAPMLQTLRARLPPSVALAGGAAGDLFKFTRTWQYGANQVFSEGVSAVLISGPVQAELTVSHGCELLGIEHVVTRADENRVYEIDGRPAWTVFQEYVGPEAQGIDALAVSHMCFAEFAAPDDAVFPGDYLIRVPISLDAKTGSLGFAAGMAQGARIQMAIRNAQSVVERTLVSVEAMARRRPQQTPLLMLQIDCACRGAMLFGDKAFEQLVDPAQQIFGKQLPWLGFHSYGEIAPLKRHLHLHNYTAVFCALYETA